MLGSLSMAAATAIAKIVLDKFYEGAGSKLGETIVEKAGETIQKLGNLIWQRCFQGKPTAEALVEKAATGSVAETETLKTYLEKVLVPGDELTTQVQAMAEEIYQVMVQIEKVAGHNVQQNFSPQNTQVNAPYATTYNLTMGDHATVNLPAPPSQG
jgi:hypothetical protein